ncbi:hypothetical protein ACFZCG_39390 [Streptomyces tanashiensis]|uniref:hypothetical protein n=1 Tax=Streptomyces tanashiensis TaxID=67367 RepID=UPI0036E60313
MSDHPAQDVAFWSTSSATGRRYEALLDDGTVEAWTELPLGESLYAAGDDDPDHNPICGCPLLPTSFGLECGGCTVACAQCTCHRPLVLLATRLTTPFHSVRQDP